MQDAFLAPRFVGKRFESSAIPLDVLKDLAVLEDFVRALARDAFLRAHRDRQRVPSGFIGGMSLQLAAVTSGSAVAEITLVAEAPGLFGSP